MSQPQKVRLTLALAAIEAIVIIALLLAGSPLPILAGVSFAGSLAIALLWLQR